MELQEHGLAARPQPVGGLLGRQFQDGGWLGPLPAPAVFCL